ncbi:hypothetical protein Vi05172_g10566 [Venturia inaequalis]|nr:hypothetical protein Vi05172_g10566 [Venturia inaequalis]
MAIVQLGTSIEEPILKFGQAVFVKTQFDSRVVEKGKNGTGKNSRHNLDDVRDVGLYCMTK